MDPFTRYPSVIGRIYRNRYPFAADVGWVLCGPFHDLIV